MTEADFVRATRESYDTMAGYYAQWIRDELAARPVDRALLAGFAELVQEADAGPLISDAVPAGSAPNGRTDGVADW